MRKGLFHEMKEFMFSGHMARTSAAYAIGAATADFAKVITFSMLIPCIQLAWGAASFTPSTAARNIDFALVVEHLLYWFCVIFVAYFLAELFFSQIILGIKTTIDAKEERKLAVAESAADRRAEEIKSVITGERSDAAPPTAAPLTPGVHPVDAGAAPRAAPNLMPYGIGSL